MVILFMSERVDDSKNKAVSTNVESRYYSDRHNRISGKFDRIKFLLLSFITHFVFSQRYFIQKKRKFKSVFYTNKCVLNVIIEIKKIRQ